MRLPSNGQSEAEPSAARERLKDGDPIYPEEQYGPVAISLGRYVQQNYEAYGLHPETARLVRTFAAAVADKLREAEKKYGYSDGWRSADWENECRRQLHHHADKGDPRDVAAYAAFCWRHGWPTTAPSDGPTPPSAKDTADRQPSPRDEQQTDPSTLAREAGE